MRLIGVQVLNGAEDTERLGCTYHCRKLQFLADVKENDLPDQHLSDATVTKIISRALGQPFDDVTGKADQQNIEKGP